MKIAVILLSCLVGATYQHKTHFSDLQSRQEPKEGEGAAQDPRAVIFSFIGLFTTTYITTVTTSWTTVSSTATTASIISCIPKSYFSSSTACRRRRAMFQDSGLAEHLLPSPKDEVTPSVAEQLERQVEPEIVSSQQEADDQTPHVLRKRYIYSRTTQTVYSTSTIYSFTSTTYTKTLSIGKTTSVLICLPSGISVC